MAVVVEKHALAGLGSVAGPLREGSAVGITGAHECEEGISHLCGKCTWTNATTRMGNHKVGVTEPEADVETVECAHTSVEKRRLPIEPSQIERCRLYSLGIDGSDDTIAGAIDVAEQLNGGLVGKGLTVGFDDGLGITTGLRALDERHKLLVGKRFEGGIGAADGILASSGTENHRHIG